MKLISHLLLVLCLSSFALTSYADEEILLAAAIGAPEAVNRTESRTTTESQTSGAGVRKIQPQSW